MANVYQIHLTNEEVDFINKNGWGIAESNPKIKAYLDKTFPSDFTNDNLKYFKIVAEVDSNDLEEIFNLMNMWDDPTKVVKLGECYSLSVGDIVEINNKYYLCDTCGWKELENVEI